MASSYVCAGFETIAAITKKFMSGDRFDDHFKVEDIENMFGQSCNKYLHSFGQNFRERKNYKKYVANEVRMFNICHDLGIFKQSEFFVDSGGFQISVGLLGKDQMQSLYDLYHQFLIDHVNLYDRAFVLDIPPGPGCKIYDNFQQVYDINKMSYLHANNLPDEVKKKMVYIHHFRTPQLWDIYTRIMDESDLFNEFTYHATGGIVANMSSDMMIPCIIYILPLIPLLARAKKYGRSRLDFHILGGATYRDILFYEFFKVHVMKKHNIDLHITYDSSTIFKGLMVGRHLYVLEDGVIRKLDVREWKLDLRYGSDKKIIESYRNAVRRMSDRFGIKPVPMDEVYAEDSGTFHYENRMYSVLYMLDFYTRIEEFLREYVHMIYPLYESGEWEEFGMQLTEITKNINGGRITKKQTSKCQSIRKSLDMLTDLDEDHCHYIVNKFLAKDEFTDLMNGGLMTV